MIIKDEAIIKMIDKVRSSELRGMIEDYPVDQIDGRSDKDMLINELEWLLEKYEGDGWDQYEELTKARHILRVTKNGKYNFFDEDLNLRYSNYDIQRSKDIVNEYNRLKRLYNKLIGR